MNPLPTRFKSILSQSSDLFKEERKEGNVLFNDTLNTFYIASDMVKDHSDSERVNPLPPHGPLLHQLWSTGWNKK